MTSSAPDLPKIVQNQETVLTAAQVAGEAGITAADAAQALAGPDGDIKKCRGTAGKALSALVKRGLLETTGTRGHWRTTRIGGLPEAPADAEPEDRGRPSDISRVRKIADRADELRDRLTPEEREQLDVFRAVHGIDDFKLWLPGMFPTRFTAPFAEHHEELLRWAWSVEADKPKDPFIAVWNRGGAKSMLAEASLVAMAARGARKYALYVSGTQNLADEHVGNMGGLLESPNFAAAYPGLGRREVGKYGESKGWRRNRLRTAAGFTVDALGLDVAARGARIDEQRPDVIVLDDVDSDNDTPHMTEKKIRSITRKLLPAGSQDVVVLFVQNMIHSQSIAARLARMERAPKADYMARRIISGPIPAVRDLTWRETDDGYEITGGEPTWAGMPLSSCQHLLNLLGLTAFLIEAQHLEADLSGGMFDHLDFSADSILTCTEAQVPELVHIGCWVDPAVSATDRSDSCALVIDGLGVDGHYYRLWSWERIATPTVALKTALRTAIEHGIQYRPRSLVVGVETDQGGITWEVVYREALRELMEEDPELFAQEGARVPRYESAKAGSTQMGKIERASLMQADYELKRFRHVYGRMNALEGGLKRFPKFKPFDCVDASFWSWRWLAELGGENVVGRSVKVRASRRSVAEVSAANI